MARGLQPHFPLRVQTRHRDEVGHMLVHHAHPMWIVDHPTQRGKLLLSTPTGPLRLIRQQQPLPHHSPLPHHHRPSLAGHPTQASRFAQHPDPLAHLALLQGHAMSSKGPPPTTPLPERPPNAGPLKPSAADVSANGVTNPRPRRMSARRSRVISISPRGSLMSTTSLVAALAAAVQREEAEKSQQQPTM
ncbi:hypothetical protein BCR44DRAFT_1432032, partial [Catenaria anguillulae PL171]